MTIKTRNAKVAAEKNTSRVGSENLYWSKVWEKP